MDEEEVTSPFRFPKTSEERGRPYGEDRWVMKMVSEMGLEYTVRDPWRPKKVKDNG